MLYTRILLRNKSQHTHTHTHTHIYIYIYIYIYIFHVHQAAGIYSLNGKWGSV